jgi:hypothetical protein
LKQLFGGRRSTQRRDLAFIESGTKKRRQLGSVEDLCQSPPAA